jgi:hypothetical protein
VTIRSFNPEDLDHIRTIHERDYPDLELPNFRSMMAAFVIENSDGEVVMAGGVEAIAEAFIVTDKTKSNITIGKALIEAQTFAGFICGHYNIRELYAFVHDENYAKHLMQHGFIERQEKVLMMRV